MLHRLRTGDIARYAGLWRPQSLCAAVTSRRMAVRRSAPRVFQTHGRSALRTAGTTSFHTAINLRDSTIVFTAKGLTNPNANLHVNGSLSCSVISSTTFTITASSLSTALISNTSGNGYVGNTVIIITVNGLNLSVGTFGGGTVTASSYVAWSAAQPSYANTYGMVATRGDISITGSGYGVNFNVPSSTFYLSYYVTILRIS